MSTSVTILTGPPAAPPTPPVLSAAQERVASIFDPDFARTAVQLECPVKALEVLLDSEGDWRLLARIDPTHPIPRETFQRGDVPAQAWEGEYRAIARSGGQWHPPVSVFPGLATIVVYLSPTESAGQATSETDGATLAETGSASTLVAVPLIPVIAHVNFDEGVRQYRTWYAMSVQQKILILRDGFRDALVATSVPDLLHLMGETCRSTPSEFHDVWRGRGAALVDALAPLLGSDAAAHRSMAGLGAYG